MTDEQFLQFCQQNRDLRIERTAHGKIIIPTSDGILDSERESPSAFLKH